MSALWALSFPWWHFILRASVIYVVILLLLRLGGKRQIGQMGAGEFVAILLVSNAVQNAMNGGDNSITGGMILASVLILLSVAFAYLTYKSRRWANLLEGTPTLLVHEGKLLHAHLEKELLNLHELKIMMRRQGVHDLNDVAEAVLESDGQLSIIKKSELH
jgi:uncharacterized membrane protein YcaP (DUF421 family)